MAEEPSWIKEDTYDVNPPGPPAVKVYRYAWVNWKFGDSWSGNDPYAIYRDAGGLFLMLYNPGTTDRDPDAERTQKVYLTPEKEEPKGKVWAQMWEK